MPFHQLASVKLCYLLSIIDHSQEIGFERKSSAARLLSHTLPFDASSLADDLVELSYNEQIIYVANPVW